MGDHSFNLVFNSLHVGKREDLQLDKRVEEFMLPYICLWLFNVTRLLSHCRILVMTVSVCPHDDKL